MANCVLSVCLSVIVSYFLNTKLISRLKTAQQSADECDEASKKKGKNLNQPNARSESNHKIYGTKNPFFQCTHTYTHSLTERHFGSSLVPQAIFSISFNWNEKWLLYYDDDAMIFYTQTQSTNSNTVFSFIKW